MPEPARDARRSSSAASRDVLDVLDPSERARLALALANVTAPRNYSLEFNVGHPPSAPSPLAMRELIAPAVAAAASADRRPVNRFAKALDLGQLELVDQCSSNLVCLICQCPFDRPVALLCEHVFCEDCINRSFGYQMSPTCPTCRKKVNRALEPVAVNHVVTQLLDELVVKCPNKKQGCKWESKRGEAQDHVDYHCKFALVECSSKDCRQGVMRKDAERGCLHGKVDCQDCGVSVLNLDLERHQLELCDKRIVDCEQCDSKIVRRRTAQHVDEVCPRTLVACYGKPFGCRFECVRMHMEDHMEQCPIAIMTPFMESQQTRQTQLESTNETLRRKIEILEGQLSAVQGAMYAETKAPPADLRPFETSDAAAAIQSIANSNIPTLYDAAADHLTSQYESLRAEVTRMGTLIADVDARCSLQHYNETLRINNDIARIDAAVVHTRGQLKWFFSQRVQAIDNMRAATDRATGTDASSSRASTAGSSNAGPSNRGASLSNRGASLSSPSPSSANLSSANPSSTNLSSEAVSYNNGLGRIPVLQNHASPSPPLRPSGRRLSDSTRQDTKL